MEIIQLLSQSGKIADAVIVAVVKRTNVQFVDDRVLVPERITRAAAGPLRRDYCFSSQGLWPSSGLNTSTPSGGRVMFKENGLP